MNNEKINRYQFKTNIKCGGCLSTVTPYLDELAGAGSWEVDLSDPQRTLTVNTELSGSEIEQAVRKAGFSAEKIN